MTIHCRQGPPGRKKRNARAAPPFDGRKPARPAALPGRKRAHGRTRRRLPGKSQAKEKVTEKRPPSSAWRRGGAPNASRAPGPGADNLPAAFLPEARRPGGEELRQDRASAFSRARPSPCVRRALPRFRPDGSLSCRRGRKCRARKTPCAFGNKARAGSPPFPQGLRRAPPQSGEPSRNAPAQAEEKRRAEAQKKPRKPGRFLLRPARGRRLRAYQTRMTLSARSRLVTISSILVVSPTCFCSRR